MRRTDSQRPGQAKRLHRDQNSWLQVRMVFVDTGHPIAGELPLLKTRVHLHGDIAVTLWNGLLKVGWKPVEALWGPIRSCSRLLSIQA